MAKIGKCNYDLTIFFLKAKIDFKLSDYMYYKQQLKFYDVFILRVY